MKNKITMAILFSLSVGSTNTIADGDYLIIVDKAHNKYNVIENPLWENTDPLYTEWLDNGSLTNCSIWNPLVEAQKSDFNQSANCDFEQNRTKSIRQVNTIDGSIKIINSETESQFINKEGTRNVITSSGVPTIEKDNYNCEAWFPVSDTVYTGTVFEQERYCNRDMNQQWAYSVDNQKIGLWNETYTENSGYETKDFIGTKIWEIIEPTFSNWTDTGLIKDCENWSPVINNQNSDFSQYTNCNFEQTRTITSREQNPDTGIINITGTNIETRIIPKNNSRDIVVLSEVAIAESNSCESWMPDTSSFYFDNNFEQSRSCSINYMKRYNYALNGSVIYSFENRYTEQNGVQTQTVNGTLVLDNCTRILDQGFSKGNGKYTISTNQGNIEVLCEMTIDGGGWTLVTYAGDTINGNKTDTTGADSLKMWNPLMFKWGTMQTESPNNGVSFSRFDYFKNNVKSEDEFLAKRTSVPNKMVIFPIVNTEWFGREASEGHFDIDSNNSIIPYLKLTKTGNSGWKTETNNIVWSYVGRKSNGHPRINWNVIESENCDSCGRSYETSLNHRSILYWESYNEDDAHEIFKPYWFHGTPLSLEDGVSGNNTVDDVEFWYREK